MKRILIISMTLLIILNFWACNNMKNEKTIKIGVIDSCISSEIQDKYVTEMNDIIGVQTENNITHGSMVLSIILQNVSNCEIFYCSVYDENCIGEIDDIANAINWCIENDVDIITMSFATLNDNENVRECVNKTIKNGIIITSSCINLSDEICYPAMYDGVISVSEGFNSIGIGIPSCFIKTIFSQPFSNSPLEQAVMLAGGIQSACNKPSFFC